MSKPKLGSTGSLQAKSVVETVNQFGDHACPHCGVVIINPLDCELQQVAARCPLCGKNYSVTKKVAEIANGNKRKYDKALDRAIKEIQIA